MLLGHAPCARSLRGAAHPGLRPQRRAGRVLPLLLSRSLAEGTGRGRGGNCSCACALRRWVPQGDRRPPEGPLCACALALPPSRGAGLSQSVCRSLSSEQEGRSDFGELAAGLDYSLSPPLSRPTALFTPLPPLLAQPWRSCRRPLSPRPSRRPPGPSPLRPVAAVGAREPAPPWGRRAAAPPVRVRRAVGGP